MYIPKPLEYLDSEDIQYQLIPHQTSYTALATASLARIPDNLLTKVVVVQADNKLAMVLIPANCCIDLHSLATHVGAQHITLVPEDELGHLFPDCELGAMPPFGNLYGMKVWIANELFQRFEITFNAGNHHQLIKMNTVDFCNLVQAVAISKGYHRMNSSILIRESSSRPWHWI
ncbi:aminoacyl-tRNA deacylase [Pleionea sediminis]|uniref:aminoacyl-tRNA deacylase n=1 Tax=Pleionea sediminis TaxID=2569479 RepID=UPI0011847A6B|nr:YbaK/EbsC family protein [Pleionea sediminis]